MTIRLKEELPESEAVLAILYRPNGGIGACWEAIDLEISKIPDEDRKEELKYSEGDIHAD